MSTVLHVDDLKRKQTEEAEEVGIEEGGKGLNGPFSCFLN